MDHPIFGYREHAPEQAEQQTSSFFDNLMKIMPPENVFYYNSTPPIPAWPVDPNAPKRKEILLLCPVCPGGIMMKTGITVTDTGEKVYRCNACAKIIHLK